MEACDQRVLIEGYEPKLAAVGNPRRYGQREAGGQPIFTSNPLQIGHSQAVSAPTAEGLLGCAEHGSLTIRPRGVEKLIKMLTNLPTGRLVGNSTAATHINRSNERWDLSEDPKELNPEELDPLKLDSQG